MKFLGEYYAESAQAYKAKFEDEGIIPKEEEVGGYFGACWATMGLMKPKIRLFIEDNDYDKANGLIKDLEKDFEKQVAIDGKEADKVMIKIAVIILCLAGLALYFTHFKL